MKIFFRLSKMDLGGAEQVFLSLLKQFSKIEDFSIYFILDSSIGESVKKIESFGGKIINLNVSRNVKSIFPFVSVINSIKPDIIISAYTDTNAACLISSKLSHHTPKVIVSEHASLFEHWRNKPFIKRVILKLYVSKIYRMADYVVCVSNGLSHQVNSLLNSPEKVLTIYNPIRFKSCEIEPYKSNGVIKILAVGRICEQKDYRTLLRSIKELSLRHIVSLDIVGGIFSNTEYEFLKKLILELDIKSIVNFVGYSDNVESFYSSANVFVLSSAWEGFGNVIVEAMSFGLPIVSTNCNYGPSEILDNGKFGRLVPVGDFMALAKAIELELQTPTTTRTQLVGRAKFFSEEKIANQYIKLINFCLNG